MDSANINDRSLNGEGDSEIALLVADQKNSTADLCGDGVQRPVRDFARKLHMDIWRKLSGIGLKPSAVGGVKPADHLLSEIDNTTVTLYSDLICLPRNGKKTDPAEFDVGDFMKMIYSITFDSQ